MTSNDQLSSKLSLGSPNRLYKEGLWRLTPCSYRMMTNVLL
jgi:hypothetical protein